MRKISGKICSIAGTACILLVMGLCSLLALPEIFGYHMYHVLSGSMEPELPVGSLIYVRENAPEEVKEKDIIAFYGSLEDAGIITHRAVENNIVTGTFKTKGDANEKEDPMPVSYDLYIGKVIFSIPVLGKVLTCMTSPYGKASAACIVLLGAVLNFMGARQREKEDSL